MEKYNWLISVVIGLIQVFIAYHVLSLSKKTSRKANFEHKKEVRKKIDELINEIYVKKNRRYSVMIIDVKKIDKYPNEGCLKAEIKESRFEGVGFFWGNTDIYLNRNKKFSTNKRHNQLYYNAFDIGVIPYEWIESIELNG